MNLNPDLSCLEVNVCTEGSETDSWFSFLSFFKGLGEAVHNISQFISFFSPHFKGILQAKQKPEWAKVCSSSNDLLSTLKTFCLKAGDRCVHIWTYTRFFFFLTFSKRVVCCFTLHLLFFLCSYKEVCKFLMICIHFNLDNILHLNLKVHGYMNKYNYCYLKMSAWYIGIKIIICSYTRKNLYLKSIKKKNVISFNSNIYRGKLFLILFVI